MSLRAECHSLQMSLPTTINLCRLSLPAAVTPCRVVSVAVHSLLVSALLLLSESGGPSQLLSYPQFLQAASLAALFPFPPLLCPFLEAGLERQGLTVVPMVGEVGEVPPTASPGASIAVP